MRRKITPLFFSIAALVALSANAEEKNYVSDYSDSTTQDMGTSPAEVDEAPGVAEDTTGVTQMEEAPLKDSKFILTPQVGILSYTDTRSEDASRFTYGLRGEYNITSAFGDYSGNGSLGLGTGFIYSHLGAPGSDVFGSGSDESSVQGGANFFYIPIDAVLGYHLSDKSRIAGHLGANVTYRTVESSMQVGRGDTPNEESWDFFPAVGASFDYTIGKRMALSVIGDWTLTPGKDLFNAGLGLNFPLG